MSINNNHINNCLISVVIPVYNASKTLAACLQALNNSIFRQFETIVIDDASNDNSANIAEQYECELIRLEKNRGAANARNIGVNNSSADIIFFIDADCMVLPQTLTLVFESMRTRDKNHVIGGTYTAVPYDTQFFSRFQSIFIHYSETKRLSNPDYIATHAMAICKTDFLKTKGFNSVEYPILEDVEYSHRLKNNGYNLEIIPSLELKHGFYYTLSDSLKNAIKKTAHWTTYNIKNKDLLTDSGTASHELKITAILSVLFLVSVFTAIQSQNLLYISLPIACFITLVFINRVLIRLMFSTLGLVFSLLATFYYFFIYPYAIWYGVVLSLIRYYKDKSWPKRNLEIET